MNRFFIKKEDISGSAVSITGEDAKHISVVLRLRPGERVALCDGEGTDFTAVIEGASNGDVKLRIESAEPSKTEPRVAVTLFQGLPKAGKLEAIIEKSVELGVSAVVPFAAHRSVVRIGAKDYEAKRRRLERVAYEAAKQSRRGRVPTVDTLVTLGRVDWSRYDAVIVPYEEEKTLSMKAALHALGSIERIALVIGPEGGFEPEEIDLLSENGATVVTLGERILRTETAGPAALAMIMYQLEQKL